MLQYKMAIKNIVYDYDSTSLGSWDHSPCHGKDAYHKSVFNVCESLSVL